jgi:hypothetical protein
MKIDKAFIDKYRPCDAALEYLEPQLESNNDAVAVLERLIAKEMYDWAWWGMVRCLNTDNARLWAIYCAEAVLPIFEANYPNDNRPRLAVEEAKNNTVTDEIARAANIAASYVANVSGASYASYAAYYAAYAAHYAAYHAANPGAYYAASTVGAAFAAATRANPDLEVPLLLLGLDMLREQEAK